MFVADGSNNAIRMLNLTSEMVSTIAGTPAKPSDWSDDGPPSASLLSTPCGLAIGPASGPFMPFDLLWSEVGNSIIRRFNWLYVSTVAGTPKIVGSADGLALGSTFGSNGPQGIAILGNVMLIADTGNNVIR